MKKPLHSRRRKQILFGMNLDHIAEAANRLNRITARRFEDYVWLLQFHGKTLHLGALAWATAGQSLPDDAVDLIAHARRFTCYAPNEIPSDWLADRPRLQTMKTAWLHACIEAESLIEHLPPEEAGCLYLDATGKPVCPDPASPEFPKLTRHYGSVKGAWPRIVES
jgi:hypothetical protein